MADDKKKKPASQLFKKLEGRLKKAHEKAKVQDTVFDTSGDLPVLENGVAQLTAAYLGEIAEGKQNEGAPYFYLAGVVVEPKEVNGIPVAGLRTSIMQTIADSPAGRGGKKPTAELQLEWVYNELRKLGVITAEIDFPSGIDAALAGLVESAPFFRFRTWKGAPSAEYPNPRVNHTWNGAIEYNSGDADAGAGVTDATAQADQATDDAPPADEDPMDGADLAGDFDDLAKLVEMADDADSPGQDKAQAKLRELALAAGKTDDDVDNADNWGDVMTMITEAAAEETPEEPAEEPEPPPAKTKTKTPAKKTEVPWEPKKGEVYQYVPPGKNPKTKSPFKAVEVDVTGVDKAKKTVTLLNMDDRKTKYGPVPWTELKR